MGKIVHTPSDDANLKRGFAECTLPTQLPCVSPSDVLNASKTMPSRAARLKVQNLQPRLEQNDGEYEHESGFTNTYANK
jgi:hypothetical protein